MEVLYFLGINSFKIIYIIKFNYVSLIISDIQGVENEYIHEYFKWGTVYPRFS